MTESNPLGACRGCMFVLVFKAIAAVFILGLIAILRTLGCC
jgi:hypothetical protein